MRRSIKLGIVWSVILISTSSVFAQPAPAAERIETLTYDVSNLVRPRGDYPLPPPAEPREPRRSDSSDRASASQLPQPKVQPDESAITLNLLGDLIKSTVDRASWIDNGGQIGAIRSLGSVLVISQTAANHDAIAKLLNELNNNPGSSTMLCVRAFWVKLDQPEVAAIFAARKAIPNSSLQEMPEVPDNLLDKTHLYYVGQTTCFNSQTVNVCSGREFTYVRDLTPIVGTQAAAYDPTIATARNGVQLQVTPQIMPSGDSCVLDLHSTVVESGPATPIPVTSPTTRTGAIMQDIPGLERLSSVEQQLHTTVRLPLRKKLLIGGMTMEPGANDATSHPLYLVIEVDAMR